MPIQIQFRRDTAANWTSANPTLAQGEMGLETDTGRFKVGTGAAAWNSLAYGGIQGTTGSQGLTGSQGTTGLQGIQGVQGLQGTLGTSGAQGIQGTSGVTNVSINAQTGTTYTLASGDVGNLVTCSNASSITVTVPPSVFSTGQVVNLQQIGAGQVTFAQGAGVTITSTGATSTAPKCRAQYSAASIICVGSNSFTIVGDIS